METESTEDQIFLQEYMEKRIELQRHTQSPGQGMSRNPAGIAGFFYA